MVKGLRWIIATIIATAPAWLTWLKVDPENLQGALLKAYNTIILGSIQVPIPIIIAAAIIFIPFIFRLKSTRKQTEKPKKPWSTEVDGIPAKLYIKNMEEFRRTKKYGRSIYLQCPKHINNNLEPTGDNFRKHYYYPQGQCTSMLFCSPEP